MAASATCLRESVWLDQHKYESAECAYHSALAKRHLGLQVEGRAVSHNPISSEIEKAMNLIGNSLKGTPKPAGSQDLENRVAELERENLQTKAVLADILKRMVALEDKDVKESPPNKEQAGNEDDDFDLFGSDDDDEEVAPVKSAVIEKKKKVVIAKSTIILDVKPWDDETDMSEMESKVRSITADGLKWGASKILPVAYGIKKLQISCVVEDDKIGTDFLEESITAFDDLVQSVDIVAFNKI